METNRIESPDYIFETSWEVCNKVGGIHTVVSTKAPTLVSKFKNNYIVIGPDFNKEGANIEFEEDVNLLKLWKKTAYKEGLRIRIGRWNVKGKPIAVLVDFASIVPQKDMILKTLWENYEVDSITGQWDYLEPVFFGYAAAKAIECYVATFCKKTDKVVAHFHEWMTASGGLYLNKELPSVATLFTTHATVSGRCIAGNGLNLYGDLDKFNADEIASHFNVTAKHSIEKIAALSYDCFTTVSQITSNECKYLLTKEPDVITPNGFDDSFVFSAEMCKKKRKKSRELMIRVAETALNKKFEAEPIIIATSGRYEFRNKGLDEFIDSLGALNHDESLKEEILAYILVPGWNHGPRKDLQHYIATGEFTEEPYVISNVTHYMGDRDNDSIINKLRDNNLIGNSGGKVTVMFVPTYLNSVDGIFDLHYYEMLPGFDVTLFPSYYEPWGYTPLESIAFSVPSVTTTLSGFGKWIDTHAKGHKGVEVIERNDFNDKEVKGEIVNVLIEFSQLSSAERLKLREEAQKLSQTALWCHLVDNYYIAYDFAIKKLNKRMDNNLYLNGGENHEQINYIKHQLMKNTPTWSQIIIERTVPEALSQLEKLSRNLWWSWNTEARSLFESIDRELWNDVQRNPIALIDNLTSDRLGELVADQEFLGRLEDVYNKFSDYMKLKENRKGDKIAYFSMEYGLHSSLKIYSGGLGILAGDYLKEASDQNIPLVAVGLLYRYGYFTQKISSNGEQEASYEAQNFYKLPIVPVRDADGHWCSVSVNYPGREVVARVWKCEVGRTDLYLLDTDHDLNQYEDRSITHHLYGGDWENRLKQEIMLGIGGMKLVDEINIDADVFHCNEGHAAFTGICRIGSVINKHGLSFSEAMEVVRASSLFTTHTPVPAGHDAFPEEMMRQYMSSVPDNLKITWEQFINLGKTNPNDPHERFSMSFLACNLSQEVNGVSWLHGEVSKDILGGMWPGYFKEELHIGYVTNGVHYPTWAASSIRKIYNKAFGEDFANHKYDKSIWQNIYNVSDEELWEVRLHLKSKLVNHILERVKDPERHRLGSPQEIVKISESLKPDVLTIGFARRFATYKRAHLLFTDINRLDKIVNNPLRPVQFVFAGKAHPNDKPGQDLIKRIVEISSLPQFVGKIIFLQNYDMELARRMVQGVDVWMNTPTRPLEASGTSGEKAVMNGVLHFSVLDGWWVEGYKEGAGWGLAQERTYADQYYQDLLDAELIYTILEEEITSAYYDKDEKGISSRWLGFVKKSIADVASNFTTKRMIEDYQERFYSRLAVRHREVTADNFRIAREFAAWKRHLSSLWNDNLSIVSTRTYDISTDKIIAGVEYSSEVIIDLGKLSQDDIGVELVVAKQVTEGHAVQLGDVIELQLEKVEGRLAYYNVLMSPKRAGSFDVAIRVFAKNKHLQHRMDFALVKWS